MIFLTKIIRYFNRAKRTALLVQDNQTKLWYHIFSVIEVLPHEIPEYNIPTNKWYKNKILRSDLLSESDLYSCYLIVHDLPSIDDALNAFENPFQNNKFDAQPNHYFNTRFLKEPSGESPLVLPSNIYEKEGIASVLPKRHSGLFVWSQIDCERKVENLFRGNIISKEMKAMSQLTIDALGFDIWSKPEHLGNIYLVAPNPYFRDLDISLSVNPIGIFYQLKLRKGIHENFKIRIIDKHGDNIALDKIFGITSPIGMIELPHEPHLMELRVYNSHDDLIAIDGPSTFIKSIQLGMSMKQADVHVKVQDKNGDKEFIVEKYSAERPISIGNPSNFNAPYYFKKAEEGRKHISLEQNKEFIFFPGGKTEQEKSELKLKAKELIRSIINSSKEICFLCDPYFNVNDLIEYAFYIKNSGVDLKIINAKGSSFIDKIKAKSLFEAMNEYNKKPFQKIECRMLRGEIILHDRFIISDKNIWFLGSSFSEFGNRATCIGKIPESSNIQIIKEIEKWYYNDEYTLPIKDYIEKHSK